MDHTHVDPALPKLSQHLRHAPGPRAVSLGLANPADVVVPLVGRTRLVDLRQACFSKSISDVVRDLVPFSCHTPILTI